MNHQGNYKIEDIIPHRAPMLWLDKVLSCEDNIIECQVQHAASSAFTNHLGQRPSWVGVEYVCQAILALQGIARLNEGKQIKPGFIVGAKRVNFARAYFEAGETVLVKVETQLTVDDTFGAYFGELFIEGQRVMDTVVKGILVEDPSSILKS